MKTSKTLEKSGVGLADVEFATNPEPRCACVILADRSGSMTGAPIAELNSGLKELKASLVADTLACLRTELVVVSFDGNVTPEGEFCGPPNFLPPTLSPGGGTSMGAAVLKGLELIEARTATYRASGIGQFRPWMILLSDGRPTDDTTEAARKVKEAEARKRLAFFAVGVRDADMAKLAEFSSRPPKLLDGLRFSDFFVWLSASLSCVANSGPGDQIPLPPPNWSAV